MGVFLHVGIAAHAWRSLRRQGEDIGYPGTGVTVSHYADAGMRLDPLQEQQTL